MAKRKKIAELSCSPSVSFSEPPFENDCAWAKVKSIYGDYYAPVDIIAERIVYLVRTDNGKIFKTEELFKI
jgi:hypothetical protein